MRQRCSSQTSRTHPPFSLRTSLLHCQGLGRLLGAEQGRSLPPKPPERLQEPSAAIDGASSKEAEPTPGRRQKGIHGEEGEDLASLRLFIRLFINCKCASSGHALLRADWFAQWACMHVWQDAARPSALTWLGLGAILVIVSVAVVSTQHGSGGHASWHARRRCLGPAVAPCPNPAAAAKPCLCFHAPASHANTALAWSVLVSLGRHPSAGGQR